jgi:hypothetical protein
MNTEEPIQEATLAEGEPEEIPIPDAGRGPT